MKLRGFIIYHIAQESTRVMGVNSEELLKVA
jgi:hypothetical protein